MNKRGQFFLLAAVILVATLVTLSSTVNYTKTNKEPTRFFDLSNEIKQEGGEVINYGIYNDVDGAIENFTENMGEYVGDADPNTEVFFIYGNSSEVVVENYAKVDATVSSGLGSVNSSGCGAEISGPVAISVGGTSFQVDAQTNAKKYYGSCVRKLTLDPAVGNNLMVKISSQTYNFSLSQNQKFLIITRKVSGNETYLDIK